MHSIVSFVGKVSGSCPPATFVKDVILGYLAREFVQGFESMRVKLAGAPG
jgi:hypothetical protein